MERERFEQRLLRIFTEAGYSPWDLLTVTPEELAAIRGITAPEIRAVLYVQGKLASAPDNIFQQRSLEALYRESTENR